MEPSNPNLTNQTHFARETGRHVWGFTLESRIPAGHLVVVVAGRAGEAVVGGLAHEVDPKGDDGGAEPR